MIQDKSIDSKAKENALNKKMESDKLLDTYKQALVQATELLKQLDQLPNLLLMILLKIHMTQKSQNYRGSWTGRLNLFLKNMSLPC